MENIILENVLKVFHQIGLKNYTCEIGFGGIQGQKRAASKIWKKNIYLVLECFISIIRVIEC